MFYVAVREMGSYYYKGEAEYKPGTFFAGGGERALKARRQLWRNPRIGRLDGQTQMGVPAAIATVGGCVIDCRRAGVWRHE